MDSNTSFQNLDGDLLTFYNNHGVQLVGIDFPANVNLLKCLQNKLQKEVYDAGEYFQIMDDQNDETFVVLCKKALKAKENIFLIDHALSFRYNEMHEAIKENLVPRLKNMLKYQHIKKALFKNEKLFYHTEEFDDMKLSSLKEFEVKQDTVSISFFNNDLSDIEDVVEFVQNHPNIKAIWLNNNPLNQEEVRLRLENTHIELLNGKFTKNATRWAFKFVTFEMDVSKANQVKDDEIHYLNLSERGQIIHPIWEWFPKLSGLNIVDTTIENDFLIKLVKNLSELQCSKEKEQYLKEQKIWETTPLRYVNERNLRVNYPECIDDLQYIKKNLFKLCGNYRLLSSDQMDESSVWYLMDELGSAIQHNDIGNVKLVPFLYLPNGKIDNQTVAYSLLYPIQDLDEGQVVFRDYLLGFDETKFRSYRLSVWYEIPFDFIIDGYHQYVKNLESQMIPPLENMNQKKQEILYLPRENIKVLTDLEMVTLNLKLPYVSFTLDLDEADIVFFSAGIHDDINHYIGKFINQFPLEYALISKERLAMTIQSTFGQVPWLQETFNLQTQLPLFMGAYKEREIQHKNNVWIIKPPNMARSMDMVVTDNLDAVIRLLETGPKLAQKYIEHPLTLRKRKFDLRFIVCLESIGSLQVYLYKTFWIRIANNDYTLDVNSFTDYETHFTVMNYGRKLTQIFYPDFIKEFNQEYGPYTWEQQYEEIKNMVRQLFHALKVHRPEMAECKKTRAIYGMDLMIDTNFQPKLLEMTFSPDCTRACKFTPTFYNDIFETLFFGVPNENMIPLF